MGIIIALPLLLYAIYINGYWAEPEPPKTSRVRIEQAADTQLEQVFTVYTIERSENED